MIIKIINPSAIRQFIRDYRLPLAATFIFFGLVVFLLLGRLHDKSALGQILAFKNSPSQDYATLLSKDKSDDFQKHDVGNESNPDGNSSPDRQPTSNSPVSGAQGANPTSTTSQTVTVVSTPTSSPPPAASTPPPPGSPPVTIQPFSAFISDFKQDKAAVMQCTGSGLNLSKCTKTYSFASNVVTTNGPGSVAYYWKYSVSGSSNGNFAAGSGANTTSLNNTVTISCSNQGSFTAQFLLTTPAAAQSSVLQISHTCSLLGG